MDGIIFQDAVDRMEQSEHFRDAGVEYLVCPGTSTWLTLLGRTQGGGIGLLTAS